jgi:murein DD-endopeptidase MepM/ murein hydrolase activator NlpD
VSTGQRLHAGEVISLSGTTGRSTGPHLHYQLELAHRPLDPLAFRSGKPVEVALPVAPPAPKRPDGKAALNAAFQKVGLAPEASAGGTDVVP